MADEDLQVRGGGGGGHPDPEITGGQSPKKFFLGPRGFPRTPPLDPPLDFVREGKERDKFLQGSLGQTATRQSRILA